MTSPSSPIPSQAHNNHATMPQDPERRSLLVNTQAHPLAASPMSSKSSKDPDGDRFTEGSSSASGAQICAAGASKGVRILGLPRHGTGIAIGSNTPQSSEELMRHGYTVAPDDGQNNLLSRKSHADFKVIVPLHRDDWTRWETLEVSRYGLSKSSFLLNALLKDAAGKTHQIAGIGFLPGSQELLVTHSCASKPTVHLMLAWLYGQRPQPSLDEAFDILEMLQVLLPSSSTLTTQSPNQPWVLLRQACLQNVQMYLSATECPALLRRALKANQASVVDLVGRFVVNSFSPLEPRWNGLQTMNPEERTALLNSPAVRYKVWKRTELNRFMSDTTKTAFRDWVCLQDQAFCAAIQQPSHVSQEEKCAMLWARLALPLGMSPQHLPSAVADAPPLLQPRPFWEKTLKAVKRRVPGVAKEFLQLAPSAMAGGAYAMCLLYMSSLRLSSVYDNAVITDGDFSYTSYWGDPSLEAWASYLRKEDLAARSIFMPSSENYEYACALGALIGTLDFLIYKHFVPATWKPFKHIMSYQMILTGVLLSAHFALANQDVSSRYASQLKETCKNLVYLRSPDELERDADATGCCQNFEQWRDKIDELAQKDRFRYDQEEPHVRDLCSDTYVSLETMTFAMTTVWAASSYAVKYICTFASPLLVAAAKHLRWPGPKLDQLTRPLPPTQRASQPEMEIDMQPLMRGGGRILIEQHWVDRDPIDLLPEGIESDFQIITRTLPHQDHTWTMLAVNREEMSRASLILDEYLNFDEDLEIGDAAPPSQHYMFDHPAACVSVLHKLLGAIYGHPCTPTKEDALPMLALIDFLNPVIPTNQRGLDSHPAKTLKDIEKACLDVISQHTTPASALALFQTSHDLGCPDPVKKQLAKYIWSTPISDVHLLLAETMNLLLSEPEGVLQLDHRNELRLEKLLAWCQDDVSKLSELSWPEANHYGIQPAHLPTPLLLKALDLDFLSASDAEPILIARLRDRSYPAPDADDFTDLFYAYTRAHAIDISASMRPLDTTAAV